MIILIGGESRTGKTLLAQKLMEKYKVPYLSMDHLKMGLYRGLKDERYHPEQASKPLGESMWPIVQAMIMTCVENSQSLIVEGCYILPHLINDFESQYMPHIIPVFLGFSESYIRQNYESDILNYENVIEQRGGDIPEPMESYIQKNAWLKRECEKHSCDFYEIDDEYEGEIAQIMALIDSKTSQEVDK
jgi:putative acetyltransferase